MRFNKRVNHQVEGFYRAFLFVKQVITQVIVLAALAACSNEAGEERFLEVVEVEQLGVTSLQIVAGSQGSILEASTQSQFQAIASLRDGSSLDVSERVAWSSSDPDALAVNSSGLATAGATDASVQLSIDWSDFSDDLSVSVSTAPLNSLSFSGFPSSLSECLPDTQLSVTGSYSDRDSDVTELISNWGSDTASVARVSSTGLLSTLDSGSSSISAEYRGLLVNEVLAVSGPISELSKTPASAFSLEQGQSRAFTVEATEGTDIRDVTSIAEFVVVNSNILTIDANGVATAGTVEGVTSVSATCGGLATTPIDVTVTQISEPTSLIIRYASSSLSPAGPFDVGDSPIQLQAFLRFSDDSELAVTESEFIEWSVASTVSGTAASVGNSGGDEGEVRFDAIGRTTIKAVYDDDSDYFEDDIDILVE